MEASSSEIHLGEKELAEGRQCATDFCETFGREKDLGSLVEGSKSVLGGTASFVSLVQGENESSELVDLEYVEGSEVIESQGQEDEIEFNEGNLDEELNSSMPLSSDISQDRNNSELGKVRYFKIETS